MKQEYLFICGCPRSGTTALVRLLNAHKSIGIGMERYKYYASQQNVHKINSNAFKAENFFNLQDEQTNLKWTQYYDDLRIKYQQGIDIVGDKYPHYYRFYDQINSNLNNVKWIFIVRNVVDVAKSYNVRSANPEDGWPSEANYKRAVVHWNESLAKTWKYQKSNYNPNLFICEYERLFGYETDYLKSLLNFLNVNFDSNIKAYFERMEQEWNTKQQYRSKPKANLNKLEIQYIEANAKQNLKNNLVNKFDKLVKV